LLPLRIALPTALVAAALLTSPAAAHEPSLRTAAVDGGAVAATVTGGVRTGVWRLVVRRLHGGARLIVRIERGDIAWGGRVVAQRRVGDRWLTTASAHLDAAGQLPRTVCAPDIRACAVAGTILAPHPGAQDLEAGFRLAGGGTWTVTGTVRQASEPFVYGAWRASGTDTLRF
jgi:hypothetical protein